MRAEHQPLLILIKLLELPDKTYVLIGSSLDSMKQIPEVSDYEIKVRNQWVQYLMKDLKAMTIPIFPKPVYGYDGSFSSLQIGDSYTGATYLWWTLPKEWEMLGKITGRIYRKFFHSVENCEMKQNQ